MAGRSAFTEVRPSGRQRPQPPTFSPPPPPVAPKPYLVQGPRDDPYRRTIVQATNVEPMPLDRSYIQPNVEDVTLQTRYAQSSKMEEISRSRNYIQPLKVEEISRSRNYNEPLEVEELSRSRNYSQPAIFEELTPRRPYTEPPSGEFSFPQRNQVDPDQFELRRPEMMSSELSKQGFQNYRLKRNLIHQWVMMRLWVNDHISKEVRREVSQEDIGPMGMNLRLHLPMKSMTTSVLVDPDSDVNGRRLQGKYGAPSGGMVDFDILPDNIYFVFGIPRAKQSKHPRVMDFIETVSTDIAKSLKDDLSEISQSKRQNATDGRFRRSQKQPEPEDTAINKTTKLETDEREKYKRWYSDDLKKSRRYNEDEMDKQDQWEDEHVKPSPLGNEDIRKLRFWETDKYEDSPRLGKDYGGYEADDIGKSQKWDTDDQALDRPSRIQNFENDNRDLKSSRFDQHVDYDKYKERESSSNLRGTVDQEGKRSGFDYEYARHLRKW